MRTINIASCADCGSVHRAGATYHPGAKQNVVSGYIASSCDWASQTDQIASVGRQVVGHIGI